MSGVWGKIPFFDPKRITTITFADTPAAPVTVFTVTGDVVVKIIAVCDTNVTSAAGGNISVGTAAAPTGIIASTVAANLLAREIWHDNSPDSELELFSVCKEFIISDGNDIILTPSAQIDTGAITFYCDWCPLSTNGSVI